MFYFFLSFFCLFFSANNSHAIDDFAVDQKINYVINEIGDASVVQEISLTNNLSEIYPKEYQITLYSTNIKNITGSDQYGNVVDKINQLDNNTLILIKFNRAMVGKGKMNKFTLNYQINGLAQHKGSVWEIPLPDYKNINSQDTIDLNLSVPAKFGHISYSSISTSNVNTIGPNTQINLNEIDIKNKKMLFIFGNYQLFDFDFKYFLENKSENSGVMEIPLPPDTNNQKIIFESIIPKPKNVRVDQDGNWIAQYNLEPNETIEINAKGQAKIYSKSNKKNSIDIKNYLTSQKHWPVEDTTIKRIADTLKTPRDIYNFTINNLSYNYDLSNAYRKGALEALLNPNSSLCTEFSDVFVTLARAKGIPAREVEGYAYSNNPKIKPVNTTTDILHAWPQYYDSIKQTWVDIDPTWAKTTNGIDYFNDLDLNHFTFVTHGIDSEIPFPPGSYKNNQQIKTVNIEFATKPIEETYLPLYISNDGNKKNAKQYINISNPNKNSIGPILISLPGTKWKHSIEFMTPYSSQRIEAPKLNFIESVLPKNQKLNFKIEDINQGKSTYFKVPYLPHFLNLSITIGIIILSLITSAIFFLIKYKK